MSQPTFEAPGPGPWQRDTSHWPRALSPLTSELLPEPLEHGFGLTFGRYGLPIGAMRWRAVNGFAYTQMEPASPEQIPALFAEAEQAVAERRWLADLERWDTVNKPAAIAAQTELAAVDVSALDEPALFSHLDECRANLLTQVVNHFDFTAPAFLPVGDFVGFAQGATGCSMLEALDLLQGWAPVSAAQDPLLNGVLAALDADGEARALLHADRPAGEVLQELRGRVGAPLEAWLRFAGLRPVGGIFDLTHPMAIERPDVLVRALRAACQGAAPGDATDAGPTLRTRVPEGEREAFDERLADARAVYRLRDERAIYADVWATGLLRRAVLEAGRRLADDGRLADAEDLIDASYEEIMAMMAGAAAPNAAELAERRTRRVEADPTQAPSFLGDPPAGPPPMDALPPGAARLIGSMAIAMGSAHGGMSTAEHDDDLLRGLAANGGEYEGLARLIRTTDDLADFVDGEVLVAVSTSEAFNLAMSFAGAVVTDTGGALSHTAVVCREYGIPAVTGCRDATARIPDGALVRVDGTTGEVQILKRP